MISQFRKEAVWLITGSTVILAALALGFILYFTRPFMVPFVLAMFISSLASPLLDLQVIKYKVPRSIALTVTLLAVFIVITTICLVIMISFQSIITTAGSYSEDFTRLIRTGLDKLGTMGIDLNKEMLTEELKSLIPGLIGNSFGSLMSVLSVLTLVTIFVLFLLAGRNPYAIQEGIYAEVDTRVRRYIATKFAVSLATAIGVWIILLLFRLQLAGVFALFVFLLNFIPSIGSIIATLLPLPIAFAQYDNPWMITGVLVIPGIIQISIGNILEPKLMGKGMNLHPVTIVLALSFWGLLWGIIGMLLAMPITAIIRIILMQFDTLKPIGQLLAGQLPRSKIKPQDD